MILPLLFLLIYINMVKSLIKLKNIAVSLSLFIILFACTSSISHNKIKSYDKIKNEIIAKRDTICEYYLKANEQKKDSVLASTQHYLLQTITKDLMPAWNGTTWDFNGISEEPQKGSVACGMFVTIILKHAGFNISRIKSGRLASEVLIKKLSTNIKRFSNIKMEKVIDYVKSNSDGIYIVGLDTHVGFITKKGNELRFVHSNYYKPHVKVMSQKLTETSPLTDSHYRVIGKILDEEMVKKWILNEKVD